AGAQLAARSSFALARARGAVGRPYVSQLRAVAQAGSHLCARFPRPQHGGTARHRVGAPLGSHAADRRTRTAMKAHRVELPTPAGRGVAVRVLIDGYGGGDYARKLTRELAVHGVDAHIYRPERWWRLERKLLRRLHRKMSVFDDALAFVGGINIIDDHNLPEGE